MTTALLTLGRLPAALALARGLAASGTRVIIAEPFQWHLCRASRSVDKCYTVPSPNQNLQGYRESILDIVAREGVDIVIPVSEEAYHVTALGPLLPVGTRLLAPDHDTYQQLSDKLSFARRARELGLTVPETYSRRDPAAASLTARCDYIVKPSNGCSGIGVERYGAGTPVPETDQLDGSATAGDLIQQAIDGTVVSTLTLLKRGQNTITVAYRGSVFAGSVAVNFERVSDPAISDWITGFCSDLEFTGFIAFDFIVDQQGTPWAIECNPRPTSGIHFIEEEFLGRALSTDAVHPDDSASGWGSSGEMPRATAPRLERGQWAYSTLTEAYRYLFKGDFATYRACMKSLFTSRDVIWSTRDPLPFLLMTPLSWSILKPALFDGVSLGEATQRDIAPLWEQSNVPGQSADGNTTSV